MKYDPIKHHRRSIRLKGYDYSQSGLYFITLCCKDRACLFGNIIDGEMILNQYGQIAYNEWLRTPQIRQYVELGEFIIMPNHMHGIIRLYGRGELHSPHIIGESHSPDKWGELHAADRMDENILSQYSTKNMNELHSPDKWGELHTPHKRGESISPLRGPSQTVGAIVRGYKSAVTKHLNALNIGCSVWQRNYYEHIIRNEQSYLTISEYILNNPANWDNDSLK